MLEVYYNKKKNLDLQQVFAGTNIIGETTKNQKHWVLADFAI